MIQLGIIGITVTALMLTFAPASADGRYPPDCDLQAEGTAWGTNCYLGEDGISYERVGQYSVGVQRILRQFGYYGGTIDGIFGPQTADAMGDYQGDRGLVGDEIVGQFTWSELRSELEFIRQQNGYRHYKITLSGDKIQFRWSQITDLWYVRQIDPAGEWQALFSVQGPF